LPGAPSPQTAMAQPSPPLSLFSLLPFFPSPPLPSFFSPTLSFPLPLVLPSPPSFLLSKTVNRSPQIYNNTLKSALFRFFFFPYVTHGTSCAMLNIDWTPLPIAIEDVHELFSVTRPEPTCQISDHKQNAEPTFPDPTNVRWRQKLDFQNKLH